MTNGAQETTQSSSEAVEESGLQSEASPIGSPDRPLEPAEEVASDKPETLVAEPQPAPETVGRESEPANQGTSGVLAAAQESPRSRLLPLAVTAAVGGLLGFGGSFTLHYIDASGRNPAADKEITDLTGRLNALENKTDAATAAAHKALAVVETRVAAAESAAHQAADTARTAAADLQTSLSAKAPAAESSPSPSQQERVETPDIGPLSARLENLEQKLTALEATQRAKERRLEKPSVLPQIARAQTLAIVAQSLLLKLASGRPFTDELAVLESLGVPADALASLRGADLLSERQLVAQFAALAPQILATDNAANEEENFLDRVTRHAKQLVHVHKTGGTDLDTLVERIGKALADHDLETAYKAWTDLPTSAESIAENFGAALKARIEALAAARSIEAEAVAALGKS